jgi:hypothetical protein
MSHDVIIRGNYQHENPSVQAELKWAPDDSMSFDDQVSQFRKMLRLYLKAREVGGDPVMWNDPGD